MNAINRLFSYQLSQSTQRALKDILDGWRQWRVALLLASHDIKLRYRRSILGPLWITLSMGITVYTVGFLYSHLFHSDIVTYFPYLATGMLLWALLSTLVTDLTDTFSTSAGLLKQYKLPYSLYIHRIVLRNMLIFFHNALVLVPLMIFFHETMPVNWNTLFLIPTLMLLYLNAVAWGMIFSMLGARYRDVSQIIKSCIQIIFFVTPIIWMPSILPPAKQVFVKINPVAAFMEMMRAPLLGHIPSAHDVFYSLLVTAIGMAICYKLFVNYRARIVFWV